MRRSGTTPLPIQPAHALRTSELPDNHNDPFDRLTWALARRPASELLQEAVEAAVRRQRLSEEAEGYVAARVAEVGRTRTSTGS